MPHRPRKAEAPPEDVVLAEVGDVEEGREEPPALPIELLPILLPVRTRSKGKGRQR